jgi:hypothetical protein
VDHDLRRRSYELRKALVISCSSHRGGPGRCRPPTQQTDMSITGHPGKGPSVQMSHDRRVERPALTLPASPRPATPILTGVRL